MAMGVSITPHLVHISPSGKTTTIFHPKTVSLLQWAKAVSTPCRGKFSPCVTARTRPPACISKRATDMIPNYAAAKFAKDARRKARRRTFVLQVPDNKTDLVKLAAPCGFKCRTIFNSGGMHLLGEHSKLDNTP